MICSEYTDFKTVGAGLLPEVHAHCPLHIREGLHMPRVKFHRASVNVTATYLQKVDTNILLLTFLHCF